MIIGHLWNDESRENGDKSVLVPLLHNRTRVYWPWNEPGPRSKKYWLIVWMVVTSGHI